MPIGLKGNSDGSGAIQIGGSDAISISTGLNTTFAGTITASGGVMYPLTSGTAIASTSGTAIDFTGIPSWVKRITVMFNGVSTNGTSNYLIQLGTASGIETTGYVSAANYSTSTSAAGSAGFFILYGIAAAADVIQGAAIICNLSGNTWVSNGNFCDNGQRNSSSAGAKSLSATLDRVRITTVNGTDAFDAGTINILYE